MNTASGAVEIQHHMKKASIYLILMVLLAGFAAPALAQTSVPASADTGVQPESYFNSLQAQGAVSTTPPVDTAVTPAVDPAQLAVTSTTPTVVENTVPVAEPVVVAQVMPNYSSGGTPIDAAHGYNQSYLLTDMGQLRAEINELRILSDNTQNVGYDGGFYIKTTDNKFKFGINASVQGRFTTNIAEDSENGVTFNNRRSTLVFSGNVYTEKAPFAFVINLQSGQMVGLDVGYDFAPQFMVHFVRDAPVVAVENTESSARQMFILPSLLLGRFGVGDDVGLIFSGAFGKFSYAATVFNGIDGKGYSANVNNEFAYSTRLDYAVLGSLSPGECDLAYSAEPAISLGAGALFAHFEEATQARVMIGSGDIRFKYRGLSFRASSAWRQVDPDQFTRAQSDIAFSSNIGYFIIPKKLEIATRFSMLVDDLEGVGNNIAQATDVDTRMGGMLGGGDVIGDSDNEWEASLAMSYYLLKYNVKFQAQYMFMVDGIAGADDNVSHIGVVMAQLRF